MSYQQKDEYRGIGNGESGCLSDIGAEVTHVPIQMGVVATVERVHRLGLKEQNGPVGGLAVQDCQISALPLPSNDEPRAKPVM